MKVMYQITKKKVLIEKKTTATKVQQTRKLTLHAITLDS